MEYVHGVAEAEALFRLVSTRSRLLNLYAGAGTFLGCEWIDPRRKIPEQYVLDLKERQFLYGIQAFTEMDIYLGRRLAVGVRAACPLTFTSLVRSAQWESGLVLRIDI